MNAFRRDEIRPSATDPGPALMFATNDLGELGIQIGDSSHWLDAKEALRLSRFLESQKPLIVAAARRAP